MSLIDLEPLEDPVRARTLAARDPAAITAAWSLAWEEACAGPVPDLAGRVIQTHYKPFERSRLVVEGRVEHATRGWVRQPLYLQLYPDRATALERVESSRQKKRLLGCEGPAVFEVPAWNAAAWALPNGPSLRTLRSFLKKKALRRFSRRIELPFAEHPDLPLPRLLRYVPRKRALLLWEPPEGRTPIYIKAYCLDEDGPAVENLRSMVAAHEAGQLWFRVPRVLAHAPHRRAVLMEGLPGRVLTARFADLDPAVFASVARSLASLHRSDLVARGNWFPIRELHALARGAADLEQVLPASELPIQLLVEELRRDAANHDFPGGRPIHANMQGDQVLVSRDEVAIVDWDDLSHGDPLFDLGRLIAHFLFVAVRDRLPAVEVAACVAATVEEYGRASGQPVDLPRLRWQISVALVLRAKISGLRMLPVGWEGQVGGAVREALLVFQDRSAYLDSLTAG